MRIYLIKFFLFFFFGFLVFRLLIFNFSLLDISQKYYSVLFAASLDCKKSFELLEETLKIKNPYRQELLVLASGYFYTLLENTIHAEKLENTLPKNRITYVVIQDSDCNLNFSFKALIKNLSPYLNSKNAIHKIQMQQILQGLNAFYSGY